MPASPRKALVAAGAALALGLTGPASAAAACPGETTVSALLSEPAIEASVSCLMNEERAAAGLAPLAPNPKLRSAALAHSTEMVQQGYFAHTSPAGVGFLQRILASGYTARARAWLAGENLAWGTGGLSSPKAMVDAWMQSPPHRANVLRPRFREVGVGVVRGTPFNPTLLGGVVMAAEYGFRATKPPKRKKIRRASGGRRRA